MISRYRQVLGLPGALAFSASGLLARLPISMVSLGIVLLVSAHSGSYGLAGTVSASYIIANAVFAVPQGRLVDRLGQSRVLPWTILVFAVGLATTMAAVQNGWSALVALVSAALAGASLPQVGSCVRARWSTLIDDKRQLQTAFAFEAAVDEAVFMIGPTMVTFLATKVHPLAGLGAAITAAVVGTLALTVQRRTEPPVTPRRDGERRSEPMGWSVIGPLVASAVAMGVLFGATEVATVAFSGELGHKALSGPLLAIWALGSLLSGLVTGALHIRATNRTRFRWSLLALALAMLPLPFLQGFPLMAVVLFVAGFAISPTLIASVGWIEETVPQGRLTEGISIVTTGLAAGVAPGAAVVGHVIDAHGASAGYWVPVIAGFAGAAIAFGSALFPRFTGREPSPT
jgi:MFS family permease